MSRQLLAATSILAVSTAAFSGLACAADLPRKAPPPVPAAAFAWDGLYAGVQIGYGWVKSSGVLTDLTGTNPIPWSVGLDGVVGGAHAGYDRRYGAFVLGIEADIEAIGQKESTVAPGGAFRFGPTLPDVRFESKLSWLASVRGRVGMPFGQTLVYATGGFAMGDVTTAYFPAGLPIPFLGTVTNVRPGWTIGAGLEHVIARDWTARLEYRYTELETVELLTFANAAADQNKLSLHAVRLGLSWRPGSGTTAGEFPGPPARTTADTARWTGFYAGAHLGGVWDRTTGNLFGVPEQTFGTFVPAATADLDASSVIGGVQSGYNYQLGNLVLGVEQDVSFASLKSSTSLTSDVLGFPAVVSATAKLDWLASTRGRLGYAPNGQWLIYGTGGIAYGRAHAETHVTFPAQAYDGALADTRVGWIAGAGVQYALNDRWSVRAEYLHYDIGAMNVIALPVSPNPPFQTQAEFGWRGDIVRAGVDYKFAGPAPVQTVASALPAKAPPMKAFLADPNIQATFGGRYWYSTGNSRRDLFGFTPFDQTMVSRITNDKLTAHSAETFFRLDQRSGLFAKGFFGVGVMPSGKQNDEDFPPIVATYTNTESSIRNSKIAYVSADIGYEFVRTARYRLGAFAGYHYDHEKMNEYGCRQVAAGGFCTVPGPVSTAALDITDDNRWHSLRLGLNGSIQLGDRWTLSGDAAWLPYTRLDSTDTHWLRQSSVPSAGLSLFGAQPVDGVGHTGYQLEAVLDYKVTDAFSIGIGGRYWRMDTTGKAHFENVVVDVGSSGSPQDVDYTLRRYGGFVQASYRF